MSDRQFGAPPQTLRSPVILSASRARAGQAQIAFNKFRNHCQANGYEYADWDAALYSWLDKELRYNGGRETQDRNRFDDRP